ncbi:MAG: SusD/RagB family nutrient-binding outer membrane lipoprotein [Cyclobacteriaceae bacterium]|nr:SusD/RagB family nutrient-binding outer membrane lipoprotein [Cyclobacteriaceae bacterium]
MKYKNKSVAILLALVFLPMINGCESYLDINKDPNNPTTAPITGLLAHASFETGDNVQNISNITSYYMQYLASPNAASSSDTQEPVPYDQTWFELYDVMTDLSDLEVQAGELNARNYLGIAKILKAINLGLTIDLWGNIPYTEAFFAETLTPAYDSDQVLYDTLQQLLDEAIVMLGSGEFTFEVGNDDFIYEGDIDLWIKTAHALKARYLLHLSKTPEFNAANVLSAIDKSYADNVEDATVSYFEEQINPWASVAQANDALILGGWISEQLVEAMDGTSYGVVDPRMPYMFGETENGEFVGTENGAGRGDAPEQGARSTLVLGTYYSSRTSPLEIITYAECKFIEAEAALATNPARAYNAYLNGIIAHMEKVGVESDEIQAYISNPAVAVGAGALTSDLIMKEKYLAMFLNPESWVDGRRYDYNYKDMTAPQNLNPNLGGQFLRRLIYPESETQRNGLNVPNVNLLNRLWWDK